MHKSKAKTRGGQNAQGGEGTGPGGRYRTPTGAVHHLLLVVPKGNPGTLLEVRQGSGHLSLSALRGQGGMNALE